MPSFKKIAHRGASGRYPENSRLAFEKAIAAGADMIEIDCQLSADGQVVVFHDERLARTTGARGKVHDKTLAQLRALDIGKWRNPAFRGEKILTLEEALEVFAGKVDLCLEIKCSTGAPPGIELKLLFILSHYDYLDRTVISSFDYRSLARVRELAPEAGLAVLHGMGSKEDPLTVAERLGASSIHVQKQLAHREFCHRAWAEGLDVFVWTVNDRREIDRFVDLGVQGIFFRLSGKACWHWLAPLIAAAVISMGRYGGPPKASLPASLSSRSFSCKQLDLKVFCLTWRIKQLKSTPVYVRSAWIGGESFL